MPILNSLTGMNEADRLGLETYLESSEDGMALYEACGFKCLSTSYWDAKKENPSQKWKELEESLGTPIMTHLMWRPVGGKVRKGETGSPMKA